MRRTRFARIALLLAPLALLGCGTDVPPLRATPPAPPGGDEPNFQINARTWLMAGDGLTPRDATWNVTVSWVGSPDGAPRVVDLWIDQGPGVRLQAASGTSFQGALPAPALGEHTVLFGADGQASAFAARPLRVSAALYAVVSTDWDNSDNLDTYLHNIETLRMHHPGLLLTQFFGPYALTDPMVTPERKQVNLEWAQRQRAAGDEMGVHIHPWCVFVQTVKLGGTPISCRTQPSTVYPNGDTTGYTVIFASYSLEEQTALLSGAADLLEQNGLGRPTSFRAGGWTAQLSTIDACARAGYTVESSAFPPETIQTAWRGYELARWTLANWGGISAVSQPYYPSQSNLLGSQPPPDFPVLEVPDNGCLVDYMTGPQMIDVLHMNFPDGKPLDAPRVFQIGLHPPDFNAGYLARMEQALSEVDQHLLDADAGPIRYQTLSELKKVWAQ